MEVPGLSYCVNSEYARGIHMQKGDRVKGKGGADSLIDNCKEPIRLLHWLSIQI